MIEVNRKTTGSRRRKASSFSAAAAWVVLLAALVVGCLNDSEQSARGKTGSVSVTLVFDRVGVLAKGADIALRKLYLTAYTAGEDTLRDSVDLNGAGLQVVQRTFAGLTGGKTWWVSARGVDQGGVAVYQDSASFTVTAGQTRSVSLTLVPRFSMLKTRIFPVRDSVTSVTLFVNNTQVARESFAKQSKVGDTVRMAWDYLPASAAGTVAVMRLEVRGDYFGQPNVLLYSGTQSITVFSARDTAYQINLQWAQPSPPPFGQASMTVVLGAVGNVLLNGKIQGFTWQPVGDATALTDDVENITLALDASGHPVVALRDNPFISVLRWNGSAWSPLGDTSISLSNTDGPSLALNSEGQPVVAYMDFQHQGKLTVLGWNGSAWSTIGGIGVSSQRGYYPSLALDSLGHPVVAYLELSETKLKVLRWNGSSWVEIGGPGESVGNTGSEPSLALDALGHPIVAFEDSERDSKLTIRRWNGSVWSTVGTAGLSAGIASYISLKLDGSGLPVVAYADNGRGNKLTVQRWSGSAWSSVGRVDVSDGIATSVSIALDASGYPVVAYRDVENGNKLTVQRWDGSQWNPVGGKGVSSGTALENSLALDALGNPFVAYMDFSNSQKMNVVKYAPQP